MLQWFLPPLERTPNDTGTIGRSRPSLLSHTRSRSGSRPHACSSDNNSCAISIVKFASHTFLWLDSPPFIPVNHKIYLNLKNLVLYLQCINKDSIKELHSFLSDINYCYDNTYIYKHTHTPFIYTCWLIDWNVYSHFGHWAKVKLYLVFRRENNIYNAKAQSSLTEIW